MALFYTQTRRHMIKSDITSDSVFSERLKNDLTYTTQRVCNSNTQVCFYISGKEWKLNIFSASFLFAHKDIEVCSSEFGLVVAGL